MMPELTDAGRARLARQPLAPDELLTHVVLRNERNRVEDLLRHHRELGFRRFLVVDNGSDDGTGEWLDRQEDVVRFFTTGSYAASRCGIAWTNGLLDRLAVGHWVLTVDADEHFVFPRCERRSVADLVNELEAEDARVYAAPLLDLYGRGPMAGQDLSPGGRLLEAFPYYDGDGYEFLHRDGQRLMARGGVRDRLFWRGRDRSKPSPFLVKYPFVKWGDGMAFDKSTHVPPGGRIASGNGLLLHFKLVPDFAESAAREARAGEHFDGASQYAVYDEVMRKQPDLDPWCSDSVRWRGSETALAQGFMKEMDQPSKGASGDA